MSFKKVVIIIVLVIIVIFVVLVNRPVVIGDKIQKEAINSIDKTTNDLSNMVANMFNNTFDYYLNKEIRGIDAKMLYDQVQNSNMNQDNKVKILFDDKTFNINKIDDNKKYFATAKYNSEGFINEINVKER